MIHEDHEAGQTHRTYLDWGPALLIVGLFILAIVWTVVLTEPIPETAAAMARTAAIALVLSGVFLTCQLTALKALTRQQAEIVRPIAAQVATNTVTIGRLEAARTIDQHNLRKAEERMEGLVRSLTGEAIEDLKKASSDGFESLSEELRQVRVILAQTYVDSLGDNPPNLRSVPPPRGRWTQEPT